MVRNFQFFLFSFLVMRHFFYNDIYIYCNTYLVKTHILDLLLGAICWSFYLPRCFVTCQQKIELIDEREVNYCILFYFRLPEHCIEYVKVLQWSKENPWGNTTPLDGDDPHHVAWVMEKAQERAMKHGISGVSYRLTQGVLKNIIPAVASTNAAIAAACATEVS